MAKHKVKIILEATDNASSKVRDLGEELEDTGEELEDTGESASAFGTALTAAAVVGAAKAVYELGQLGAQSLRTKAAFEAISGGVFNASANLDAMRAATRGAMSEQAMMANANQFLQMGIATSSEELGQMTEMAVRLGAAMGTDATASLENFSAMMANQSIPRLDTFGISSGKVTTRINELMSSIEGMTREAAFNQAVLEQGAMAMDRLGDAVEDEALAFERAEATMADAKAMLGEAVAPAVAAVTSQLALGVKELTGWGTRIKQVTGGAAAFALHLVGADEKGRDLLKGMGLIGDQAIDLTDEMARAAEVTDGWAAAVVAADEVVLLMLDAGDATKIYADALKEAGLSTVQIDQQTRMFSEALGTQLTAEQQLQADAQLLNQAYQAGTINLAALNLGLQSAASGTLQLSTAERQAMEAGIRSVEVTRQQEEAHRQAAEAAAGQAKTTMDLAGSLKDATSSQIASQLIGMLDPKKMGAEAYGKAVADIGLEFGLMDEQSIAMAENMGALATAIEDGIIPTENADEALSAFIADAEDGQVEIANLIDEFRAAPSGVDSMSSSVQNATGVLSTFESGLGTTRGELLGLVAGSPWRVDVIASGSAGLGTGLGPGPGGPSELQAGAPRGLVSQNAMGGGGVVVLAPIIVQSDEVMAPGGELDMRALEILIDRGRREYL